MEYAKHEVCLALDKNCAALVRHEHTDVESERHAQLGININQLVVTLIATSNTKRREKF